MLLRAILAFLCLPGIVAFAVPVLIGIARGGRAHYPLAGGMIIGVGTLLLMACVREIYVAGRGTLAPWSPPIRLVTSGQYRYSRNPMYLGVLGILIGWATLWASPALFIYALAVLIAVMFRVRLHEEAWAERTFADAWRSYCQHVPRWIGLSS
jgi:protein-S-isoprenylcysteine O-methyltransferase Ste14